MADLMRELGWILWCLTVLGWFLSPIISLLVNKLLACLGLDASTKLKELEIHTIPRLKQTLDDVEEKMVLRAAQDKWSLFDLKILDTMKKDLKSALYEADDILDLVDYRRIEKGLHHADDGSVWVENQLAAACAWIARCKGSWFGSRGSEFVPADPTRREMVDEEEIVEEAQVEEAETEEIQDAEEGETLEEEIEEDDDEAKEGESTSLSILRYCARSMLTWFAKASFYRDWSYGIVGIKSDKEDGSAAELVPITERISLRNRIKRIEDILTASKKSDLLNDKNSSSGTTKDPDNESSSFTVKNSAEASSSTHKEIDDLYRNIEQKVFGREEDCERISRMLRKGPETYAASSSTSNTADQTCQHIYNGFEPWAHHNAEVELDDRLSDHEALEHILCNKSEGPIELSYALLQNITNDFSQSQVIGSGGFGVVYMGVLQHKKIAVKKLLQTGSFSDKQFEDELKCLRRVKHKNIVRFLGYCSDTKEKVVEYNGKFVTAEERRRFLCFEYVPNKSLHEYLKDESHGHGHEWDICYQLIEGICQGLCYLHNKERITHLDLKPENILLDVNMVPKIADFGISRLFSVERSRIITQNIRGSRGYIAPEYWSKGEITFKSDIFSFGVILKKLLGGNIDDFSNLENWHQPPNIDNPQVKRCIEIAEICVNDDPSKRPTINCIINMLSEK